VTGVRTVAAGFHELSAWVNDPTPRIGWNMPFFDIPTGGGIAMSESCMLMAMSSVGKTTIGLNVIRNNPHIPTLFMSLEMGWRQVVSRLTAMEYGIGTQQIESELRAANGFNAYAQGVADKYRLLVCDDTPAISLRDAENSVRRATELLGEKPKLIVWDYLELIGGAGLMNKNEAVDRAAQKLRDFHRKVDAAGIILHQVGKGSNTGGHQPLALDDGRYGGHQPMDYVVGAYAPRLNKELGEQEFRNVQPELYLQLLKNRNGGAEPVGRKYRQDPVSMRITTWSEPQLVTGFTPPFRYDPDEPASEEEYYR
jgi:replicative DNA helicase